MNLRNLLLLLFFFGFFHAQANTKPVNDECTGAINVVVSGNEVTSSLAGATLSMPACTSTAYSDIWFCFTATTNRLRIIAGEINNLPVVVQLFTGTCGSLTSVACYSYANNQAEFLNLTPGTKYYYRVYLAGANPAQTTINTWITTLLIPPSNDEATGATPLGLGTTYNFAMGNATPSMPPCNSTCPNQALDQWYSFVATTADNYVTLTPVTMEFAGDSYVFQVFSGTPTDLVSLGCYASGGQGGGTDVLPTLTPGQTYYIRVYTNDASTGADNTFQLNVKAVPPPVNDECTGAINVPTNGTTVNGTLAGATLSMPACKDTAYNDIWFMFTATSTRHQIYAHASGLPNRGAIIQVFKGSCGNLTSLSCTDYSDDYADISGLTPGTTYYYRVYADGQQNTQVAVPTHILTPGTPPANDEPTGAQPVAVNTAYTGLSLGYATQTFAPCNTINSQADDTWYSFVAKTTSHNIALSQYSTGSYLNYFVFQVYSGTPTNLTSLACVPAENATTDSATINNLTVGKTYYIRVYNYESVATPSLQFNLKVSSESPAVEPKVATGSTAYAIYPNPAHTFLYVQNGNKNMPAFTISDLTGRLYLSGRLTSNQINIGQLPRGSFVLTIRDGAIPTSILFTKE